MVCQDFKLQPHGKTPTLTRFLDKLFDPSSRKARIFLQSGKTESGKSFTASAWTALLFQLNGTILGSKIDGDFVRVSDLGARYFKIIEEYKGNLPQEFYHLESNSKQLYVNNATIDPRLSLVMINCDKTPYSLDQEEQDYMNKLISKGEDHQAAAINARSRREQVQSRTYILNWGDSDKQEFRQLSEDFKLSNTAIKMFFMGLQKKNPEIQPEDWIVVSVSHSEIILRWDLHLQREMRYLTLLDCWSDLGAWAAVLSRSFELMNTGSICKMVDSGMHKGSRDIQMQNMLAFILKDSSTYQALVAAELETPDPLLAKPWTMDSDADSFLSAYN